MTVWALGLTSSRKDNTWKVLGSFIICPDQIFFIVLLRILLNNLTSPNRAGPVSLALFVIPRCQSPVQTGCLILTFLCSMNRQQTACWCWGLPVHRHFCCKPRAQEGAGKSGDAARRAIVWSLTKGLQCTGLRLQILFYFFFPWKLKVA